MSGSAEQSSDRDDDDEAILSLLPPSAEPSESPVPLHSAEIWEHSFVAGILKRFLTAPLKDITTGVKLVSEEKTDANSFKYLDAKFTYDEVVRLCKLAEKSLMRQKMILRLNEKQLPLSVVGDIHGNVIHLRRIIGTVGWPGDGYAYLFLGDYVDRGSQSLETMCYLLALQYRYPNRVYILRGNHEEANTTISYGFYDECREKFPLDNQGHLIWKHFIDVFAYLPSMAIISDKIVCMHGGLSPYMEQISDLEQIQRPCSIPAYGILSDTVWADPDVDVTGWRLSKRWVSFSFGPDVVEDFCRKNGFDMVIRAHQINRPMFRWGYRWLTNGRLVTIFSSTNYQNENNSAAIARISTKASIFSYEYIIRAFDVAYGLAGKALKRPIFVEDGDSPLLMYKIDLMKTVLCL